MAVKQKLVAQNPLILRCNRLIEAFAKSDDERDFYLDREEGFIIYADLDKPQEELLLLEKELQDSKERYCLIPKMTFYETKKIMEGFVNEKIYDIDTKEKVTDIIQSRDARENFLEFIYDHHTELEKWQIFYQERSRIRIIEWLRTNHFHFVFEEDLELPRAILESVKRERFQSKVSKEVLAARATITTKSKTYYSIEALNPRPKRGRPPKQIQKVEFEPQITMDIFITVPNEIRLFLFIPERQQNTSSLSSKLGHEVDLFSGHQMVSADNDLSMASLDKKLAALRDISKSWNVPIEPKKKDGSNQSTINNDGIDFNLDDDEDEDFFDEDEEDDDDEDFAPRKSSNKSAKAGKSSSKKEAPSKKKTALTKKTTTKKTSKVELKAEKKTAKKAEKAVSKVKPKVKETESKKTKTLRPIKTLKKSSENSKPTKLKTK